MLRCYSICCRSDLQNCHPSIVLYSLFQPALHAQKKKPMIMSHVVTHRPIVVCSSLETVQPSADPFVLKVDPMHRVLYFVNRSGAVSTWITT